MPLVPEPVEVPWLPHALHAPSQFFDGLQPPRSELIYHRLQDDPAICLGSYGEFGANAQTGFSDDLCGNRDLVLW